MNKETYLDLYNKAEGDWHEFNKLQQEEESKLSIGAFYRRRARWVNGRPYSKSKGKVNAGPLLGSQTKAATPVDDRPIAGGVIEPPDKRRLGITGKRFVFTAAQNNTYVHDDFWKSLLRFCAENDAQLVVGKFRYNKHGFQNATADRDSDLWFDPRIEPYAITEAVHLEQSPYGTVFCGELDILPTADRPFSGLESYTRSAPGIIPHAKVQMLSCPVIKGHPKKMMYTTGAVTLRNYIQKKAGQKAEFHHVFGALYVDIDEDREFRRQLIADDYGGFFDLGTYYGPDKVIKDQRVLAINWGDIHAEAIDWDVAKISWLNSDSMLDTLQPCYQFVHDLTDFSARNHHNIRNPHFLAQQHQQGTSSVEAGMYKTAQVLESMLRPFTTTVVVESNHDLAFRRWLSEADVRQDYVNAEYFHKANAHLYGMIRAGVHRYNIFEWALKQFSNALSKVTFLTEDSSYVIGGENGIECGLHGHRGSNGSRGSPNGLRKLGRKCNTGHTHSAGIIDGVYTSGISCKEDLGYNVGPSSWSNSHVLTYANGKRAIITIDKGRWR